MDTYAAGLAIPLSPLVAYVTSLSRILEFTTDNLALTDMALSIDWHVEFDFFRPAFSLKLHIIYAAVDLNLIINHWLQLNHHLLLILNTKEVLFFSSC